MPEQQEITDDTLRKNEKGAPGKFGKMGKIFLLAGIVLIQVPLAYIAINEYYPSLVKLTLTQPSEQSTYYKLKDIVINPAGSNGFRYLIFSLTVVLNNENALNTLEGHNAEAKERINRIMEGYTTEQLSSLKNRGDIKKRLGMVINNITDKKSVRNLFFTKYILQ